MEENKYPDLIQKMVDAGALNPDNLEELLFFARQTESAERFEDMCVAMGEIVKWSHKNGKGLDVDSRNMLSVAYKNVVGFFRNANRQTRQMEPAQKKVSPGTRDAYQSYIQSQLKAKCNEVLNLLHTYLIDKNKVGGQLDPNNGNGWLDVAQNAGLEKLKSQCENNEDFKNEVETQVFYLKMCGDYYRYLSEFMQTGKPIPENEDVALKAILHYDCATQLAAIALPPTHPTKLGLALNASVCYYEIKRDRTKACNLAKKAFDEAIAKLDSLSDNTYKDSTLIMQLLRDNLTIWTTESENTMEKEED